MKYKLSALIASSAVVGSLLIAAPAFAQTPAPHAWNGPLQGRMMPGVFGIVSAINGTTLSVASRGFGKNTATTTYSVDASSATVFKDGATSTLSAVAINDAVVVQGTVSGTSVAAKTIRDGFMKLGTRPMNGMKHATTSPALMGNGEPVVGGSVTAVNGSTITITNKSNVTYTIDASSAAITKKGASSATISNVAVGDNLLVQGTVNGNAVVASSVIDQGTAPAAASGTPAHNPVGTFMGFLGGFVHRLFGFF
ncbi:MAG TPA: DUF5666 domain-containing protein [Candidatus Paceibacterota bacterium]|nr:DUF5666 domain-containing protein [Candidatus Paceibacterota bacterium]